MAGIGCADYLPGHACVGHQGSAFGNLLQSGEVVADIVCGDFPDEIPDTGVGRHNVRLVSTIADDIVRSLQRMEMLATEIPGDVHQFDRIQCAASIPGIAGAMGGNSVEHVFDGNQAGAPRLTPTDGQIVGNVGKQHGVNVLKKAVSGIPGLGAQQLFSDSRPEHNRAGQVFPLHDVLDRQRGSDIDCLS